MRNEVKSLTRMRVKGRKKKLTAIIVVTLIICIIGWKIYKVQKLHHSEGWKDAHPTQEQVNRWLLKSFNPQEFEVWNKNPKLEGAEFDTGVIHNQENYFVPFGEDDWGMGIYSWGYTDYEKVSATYPVNAGKLQKNKRGESIYIFVEHRKKGQYGVGNILQGWIHKKPPPFNHYIPPPLETGGKKIVLSFDLKIEQAEVERFNPNAWQFIGSTIWFSSAELKKPLVIDLMIYANKNILYTKDANNAYRYQRVVVSDTKEAFGKWQHYDLDVSWFINDMLKRFKIEYATDTLKLYSLEILAETMFGKCGFYTKNIYLYHK